VTQNALLSLRDLKGKLNGGLEKLALQIAIQLLLLDLAQQFAHIYNMGFLDSCHRNFPMFEDCHYNSSYWKITITILDTPVRCPHLHLPCT